METKVQRLAGFGGAAAEAMDNAAAGPMFSQDLQGIVPSLAGMNHDGLPRPGRQLQLLDEGIALDLARRVIVMIVEPDLADGKYLGVGGQRFHRGERLRCGLGRVVGMHADGRVDEAVPAGETKGAFQIRRTIARADGQHAFDAGLERPSQLGVVAGVAVHHEPRGIEARAQR